VMCDIAYYAMGKSLLVAAWQNNLHIGDSGLLRQQLQCISARSSEIYFEVSSWGIGFDDVVSSSHNATHACMQEIVCAMKLLCKFGSLADLQLAMCELDLNEYVEYLCCCKLALPQFRTHALVACMAQYVMKQIKSGKARINITKVQALAKRIQNSKHRERFVKELQRARENLL